MVTHQAQRGKCLRSRLGEESDGRREPKALDSTSHPETAGHCVASPGRSGGARSRKLTHSVRRKEPLAPRHESGCDQADVAVVASRLTIPTGFHVANATGVEATTEPMRETCHQDVSCQMPHADATPGQNRQRKEPQRLTKHSHGRRIGKRKVLGAIQRRGRSGAHEPGDVADPMRRRENSGCRPHDHMLHSGRATFGPSDSRELSRRRVLTPNDSGDLILNSPGLGQPAIPVGRSTPGDRR